MVKVFALMVLVLVGLLSWVLSVLMGVLKVAGDWAAAVAGVDKGGW